MLVATLLLVRKRTGTKQFDDFLHFCCCALGTASFLSPPTHLPRDLRDCFVIQVIVTISPLLLPPQVQSSSWIVPSSTRRASLFFFFLMRCGKDRGSKSDKLRRAPASQSRWKRKGKKRRSLEDGVQTLQSTCGGVHHSGDEKDDENEEKEEKVENDEERKEEKVKEKSCVCACKGLVAGASEETKQLRFTCSYEGQKWQRLQQFSWEQRDQMKERGTFSGALCPPWRQHFSGWRASWTRFLRSPCSSPSCR